MPGDLKDNNMKRHITIIAALATLASCQKETGRIHQYGADHICFEMHIPTTKATAQGFEIGDQVTIFAVEYNGEVAPELQIAGNFINNEIMTFDGEMWTNDRILYWSDKPCDFYALYPHMNLESVEEHLFEITADQNSSDTDGDMDGYEASDILWAKEENVSRKDGKVKMHFRHLLSKCIVTITKGEKFEGEIPDDIVCHIYNTITDGKLNFANGSVEKDPQGKRKTITMKRVSNERFEAIIVPQNIERRTPLIEVTMGGIAYLLEYSLSFRPGYAHTINLILNTSPDQEKIEIAIDTEAGDWRK